MWTISESQFQVLKDGMRANVAGPLVQHCRQNSPRLCDVAGDAGIHKVVDLGIRRAEQYGFRDEPQVRFYIDMMLVLGSEFDTDPQFPWAAATLQDRFSKPQVRGLVLYRDLSLYLDRVMGPQREFVKNALTALVRMRSELPPPEHRTISTVRKWLLQLFPQKSDDVTEEQLAQIAWSAAQRAAEFKIPGGHGFLTGVMLVFGHGATRDPLYPWISNVLNDPRITSEGARLQRLWTKLRTYAESARKYLVESP